MRPRSPTTPAHCATVLLLLCSRTAAECVQSPDSRGHLVIGLESSWVSEPRESSAIDTCDPPVVSISVEVATERPPYNTFISKHTLSSAPHLERIVFDKKSRFYSISAYGLAFNPRLKTLDLGEDSSMTVLRENSFQDDVSLEEVVLPFSMSNVSAGAFLGCRSLRKVVFPFRSVTVDPAAFPSCVGLGLELNTPIDPRGRTIECVACHGVETLTIPNTVVKIMDLAFANCTDVRTLQLSTRLTMIDRSAFEGLSSLEAIHLPESVTRLEKRGFAECGAVREVDLGSVKLVDDEALAGLGAPKVVFPASAKCSRGTLKDSVALTSVTLPPFNLLVSEDNFLEGCTGLTEIVFQADSKYIPKEFCAGCSKLEVVKLPQEVTVIKEKAFFDNPNLHSITFGNEVTLIEQSAFEYATSLKTLIIPDSVKTIGEFAFRWSVVTSFALSENLESIAHSAFERCGCDSNLYVRGAIVCNCVPGRCNALGRV